jgi:flagellar hook assembly protein FlgD
LFFYSSPGEAVPTTEPEVVSTPAPASPDTGADVTINVEITVLSDCISPNNDGFKDQIAFKVNLEESENITSWKVEIINSRNGKVVDEIPGTGKQAETSISWDGKADPAPGDGIYVARLVVEYAGVADPVTAESKGFLFDTTPPSLRLRIQPLPFSPDGDNVNDSVTLSIGVEDVSPVYTWEITIYDEEGEPFHGFSGGGEPENPVVWDGINSDGHSVEIARDYRTVLTVTDNAMNTGTIEEVLPVGILLERTPDNRYKIKIGHIVFKAYASDFSEIGEEIRENNMRFLRQLYRLMNKYPEYRILIEGHAVMPRNRLDSQQQFDQYNKDVLIPLTKARAEAVKAALVDQGIDGSRIQTDGIGASRPLAPHGNLKNRWQNRRVEFYLVKD